MHGILNFLAWGVFAPTGILVARHARKRLGSNWVLYHMSIMLLTGLCSVTAIGLAFYQLSTHLVTWHQWLGTIVALAVLVQASVGMVLYRGSIGLRTRSRLAMMHRISGVVLLLLAWTNITLGIYEYYGGGGKVPPHVLYTWFGVIAVWVTIGGVLEFRRRK